MSWIGEHLYTKKWFRQFSNISRGQIYTIVSKNFGPFGTFIVNKRNTNVNTGDLKPPNKVDFPDIIFKLLKI